MNKELHFAVYEHQLVLENKQVISRKFIVLRDGASLRFTNFHEYVLPVINSSFKRNIFCIRNVVRNTAAFITGKSTCIADFS